MIVEFILEALHISKPFYLDIGAHHPVYLSNTYLFYQKGGRGVCVEPDPELCREMQAQRKQDLCLNIGVGGAHETSASFYVLSTRAINTFSREDAERYQRYGQQRIDKVISVQLVPINKILRSYFGRPPDFISLDAEGMDLAILKAFDFTTFRPKVFCIETLTYTEDKVEKKITEIIDLMISKGYRLYADTFINSIFVENDAWKNR